MKTNETMAELPTLGTRMVITREILLSESSIKVQQKMVPRLSRNRGSYPSPIWNSTVMLTHILSEPVQKPEELDETDYDAPVVSSEDAEIERRRKRRAEILARSSSATPLLLHAVGAGDKVQDETSTASQPGTPQSPIETSAASSGMRSTKPSPSPANQSAIASPSSPKSRDESMPDREVTDSSLAISHDENDDEDDEEGPSAADYDPTIDMREDERREERRHGQHVLHGEIQKVGETEGYQGNANHKSSDNDDGKDSSDIDIFGNDFDTNTYKAQSHVQPGRGGNVDGDDSRGYYKARAKDVLDQRYKVLDVLGEGTFSGVLKASDSVTDKLVAIKIIRNNDALRKGGYTEIAILKKLNESDVNDSKFIVRYERSFEFKGHLCICTEILLRNMRQELKDIATKDKRVPGISLPVCKIYARQLFIALLHMRNQHIIHADIKPDNILVS